MGKIKGREPKEQLPAKVLKLYQAVISLIEEGVDITAVKVSDITDKAGIGKGTAYDYFDTKEEIIVHAVLFYVEDSLKQMEQHIFEKPSFKERIQYVLDAVDVKTRQGACTLRFIHMLYESSQIGQSLREVMKMHTSEGNVTEDCPPLLIVSRMIERGIADGELRNDLPLKYMTYSLITRYVTYCAFKFGKDNEDKVFAQYVVDGIWEEFRAR